MPPASSASVVRSPSSDAEIRAALLTLIGWSHDQNALARKYQFADFRDATTFLMRIAFDCEELAHHPEIRAVYGTVEIRLRTHDAGNVVTSLDLNLAQRIELRAKRFGVR
jgi:4a-hydroxytetrahydrobiopterin dehydratase